MTSSWHILPTDKHFRFPVKEKSMKRGRRLWLWCRRLFKNSHNRQKGTPLLKPRGKQNKQKNHTSKNRNMEYAVLHLDKSSGNEVKMTAHIERTQMPKNADPERSHLNRELIEFPDDGLGAVTWFRQKHREFLQMTGIKLYQEPSRNKGIRV